MKSIINIIDKESGYIPGSYLTVYSYGYHKSIDTTLITQRENGRPDYQILYIDKGWGDFLIDGAMHRINEGNIVILYPSRKTIIYSTRVQIKTTTGYTFTEMEQRSCSVSLIFTAECFTQADFTHSPKL